MTLTITVAYNLMFLLCCSISLSSYDTSMAEICSTIEAASKSKGLEGIIGITTEDAVSMDFRYLLFRIFLPTFMCILVMQ